MDYSEDPNINTEPDWPDKAGAMIFSAALLNTSFWLWFSGKTWSKLKLCDFIVIELLLSVKFPVRGGLTLQYIFKDILYKLVMY